jgi:ZIP family zinc transporter
MAENTAQLADRNRKTKTAGVTTALLLLVPLVLLGLVIFVFLKTGGGLSLSSPVPIENLSFERTVLEPGRIDLSVRNTGPEPLTIAQVAINDAIWPARISPSAVLPRLGRATVHLEYPWVHGEAYALTLFTSSAIAFSTEIPVAFPTPEPTGRTFLGFTLIGLYVGVIPVYLGFFWMPALRTMGRRWMVFLLALTVGLLLFLGMDTVVEALEQAATVPGAFQGVGLAGIGAVATFLLLAAITRRQGAAGRSDADHRMSLATMIAVGIGLHNLGEGLAIGAAYNVGAITLGAFLVVGFILQNITEGLGIIAPILRDRPRLSALVLLGLLGGGPAIAGAWLGGFVPSPTLALLFLGIGAGAIFEVAYEIARMIGRDTAKGPLPMTVFSGVVTGMLLLWVTGLLIK